MSQELREWGYARVFLHEDYLGRWCLGLIDSSGSGYSMDLAPSRSLPAY